MNYLDREHEKVVGAQKSRFQWQNLLKSLDFDEHIIFSSGSCGHFALGTFSKTCLKDVVFDVSARQTIDKKSVRSKNVKSGIKNKHRIITTYCFVSIKTFQHVMIYILLEFTYVSTNKLAQICPKRVPKEYI